MDSRQGSDSSDRDTSESESDISDHEIGAVGEDHGEDGIRPYQYEPVVSEDDADDDDAGRRNQQEGNDDEGRLGNNHW